MENSFSSFSSQVIQTLKDNFVDKTVGCEHFEGEIVDVVVKPVSSQTVVSNEPHFHIKISISESIFITYDELLRLNVKEVRRVDEVKKSK